MTVRGIPVALDIGNSAVKACVSKQSLGRKIERETSDWITKSFAIGPQHGDWGRDASIVTDLLGWLRPLCNDREVAFWVSTVNRSISEPVRVELEQQLGKGVWNELTYQDVPLHIDVQFPKRVGIDRLLSAHAATRHLPRGAVVVDSGSAVTIDLVTPAGELGGDPIFHGGAIMPGVRMQHAALAGGTENLPRTAPPNDSTAVSSDSMQQPFSAPARETEAAIRLGVLSAISGAIERLAGDYSAFAANRMGSHEIGVSGGGKIAVVISGGDAELISRDLRISHIVKHNLVCQGILDLAGRKSLDSASPL
ncbi:type III pantothenate kinase [Rhodopirellula sp. MGV]|uniref:type III pantothenate kinase n=1 Tax=Rhodopirellula sp. MGV TaxID=2023130 RepID=UPI000B97ABC7|nr:type III pantothenate kinase [Rhodopirellula sp. MGV]OYP37629.1 hypothetical protein CGZ80_04775 [Rhodopirellula sp. MGV]PNY34947.1 type III pantothenate kinase [Rhodopirellula baltica]